MIRSKKKGIAKRALSVSLAAAMLLTSNVSAWAAFEAEPVDAEVQDAGFEVVDSAVELAAVGATITLNDGTNDITGSLDLNGKAAGYSITATAAVTGGTDTKHYALIVTYGDGTTAAVAQDAVANSSGDASPAAVTINKTTLDKNAGKSISFKVVGPKDSAITTSDTGLTEIATATLSVSDSSKEVSNWNSTDLDTYKAKYLTVTTTPTPVQNVEWDNQPLWSEMQTEAAKIKTAGGGTAAAAAVGVVSKGAIDANGGLPADSEFIPLGSDTSVAKANIGKVVAVKLTRTDASGDHNYYLADDVATALIDPTAIADDKIELKVNGSTVTKTSKTIPYAARYTIDEVKLTLKDNSVVTINPATAAGVTASAAASNNTKGQSLDTFTVTFASGNDYGIGAGALTLTNLTPTIGSNSFTNEVTFSGGSITYDPRVAEFKKAADKFIVSDLVKDTDYTVQYYKSVSGGEQYAATPNVGDKVYLGITGIGNYASYDPIINSTPLTITKKDLSELSIDQAVVDAIAWDTDKATTLAAVTAAMDTMVKYNASDATAFDLSTPATYSLAVDVDGGNQEGDAVTVTIRGTAPVVNYTGVKTFTFVPKVSNLPASVQSALTAAIQNFTYDAQWHSVNNLVTGSLGVLSRDQYTLTCKQAPSGSIKNAGAYEIVLTATAAPYTGMTATATLNIAKKDVSVFVNGVGVTANKVTYDPAQTAADITKKLVNPVFVCNGETLREGVDIDVTVATPADANAGTAITATVTAVASSNSNYTGIQANVPLGTIAKKSIADVEFAEIPVQKYDSTIDWYAATDLTDIAIVNEDGTAGTYDTIVKDGDTALTVSTDYTVAITPPASGVGTATAIIKGAGNYTGSVTKNFVISAEAINAEFKYYNSGTTTTSKLPEKTFAYDDANEATGIVYAASDFADAVTANKIVIVDEDGAVVPQAKYEVTYKNNTAVGTATIEATGKNGYDLHAISTFEIVPKQFVKGVAANTAKLAVAAGTYYYTGEAIEPKITVEVGDAATALKDGAYTLKEGVDYEVAYKDNINVGTATVIVKGLGNYTFVDAAAANTKINTGITNTFSVTATTLTGADITVNDVPYAGGLEVTPDITIMNPNSGKALVKDVDYTITLENGINVGVATATITLTGDAANNYTLSATTIKFQITKKALTDCTASIVDGKVVVKNGEITVPETEYDVTENEDGTFTVTAKADGNYTGTITVDPEEEPEKPEAPAATQVRVTKKDTSSVTLAWDPVEGAEGYTIWYHSEKDTTNARKIIANGDTTTWTQKGLAPGTKYFYTVRAWVKDAEGKYIFGEETSYVRGTTKPYAARIAKATATNGKIKVTLAAPAAGAEKYAMCYSKTSDFAKYSVGIRTTYTTRTFTKALSKGTYYVRVKSYRDLSATSRIYGDWSNTVKVVVK